MPRTPEPSRLKLAAASAAIGVLLGAIAMGVLEWKYRHAPAIEIRPAELGTPLPVSPPPAPAPDATPVVEADPVADLRRRRLDMPVLGAPAGALRDSFDDSRSGRRKHEAIDILAPRHTRIVAVEDGTIAKLFQSDAGGITVYQFDPTSQYVYYYAHLERYADGLAVGARVTRWQVLGYVGTSGNAPKDTPHLHFAIFKLTDTKQWWQGAPIDPYQVLK